MRILIIRFSSIGDVLQCLSVAGALRQQFPEAEIHWITREEFVPLVTDHPAVNRVWGISRSVRFFGLIRLAREMRRFDFTHVYDAHNNLRSHAIGWVLKGLFDWRAWLGQVHFLRRSIYRWRRFLLFRLRINRFPQPFSGQRALLEPLARWGLDISAPPVPQLFIAESARQSLRTKLTVGRPFVALAPSAAFALKRWPLDYWKKLILALDQFHFVLLGGPEDLFLQELVGVEPSRVTNLAGRLNLLESAAAVEASVGLVANDTGLMHVAEQIGKPCIALMGPAPFGFPSRPMTQILEVPLACRPCSKHGQGPCHNSVYQRCLREISPEQVVQAMRRWNNGPQPATVS